MKAYITLAAPATGEYEEKRSRFLALAAPVQTPEQAMALLQQEKSRYYDARHHCFAYRLADGSKRCSDDGEPQGTAGLPILDVLERQDLSDCMIVVTRYFGGTLLGTGGLVHAYAAAAGQAVNAARLLSMRPYRRCRLQCPYPDYGRLPAMVAESGGYMEEESFTDAVALTFLLPEEAVDGFCARLTESSGGQLTLTGEATVMAALTPEGPVYR